MAIRIDILPLVRTTRYQPRITGHLVPRPRLLQRLEERRDRPPLRTASPPPCQSSGDFAHPGFSALNLTPVPAEHPWPL